MYTYTVFPVSFSAATEAKIYGWKEGIYDTNKSLFLLDSMFMDIYNLGNLLVGICDIWQKVLFRELAKSPYFRYASSESDNK